MQVEKKSNNTLSPHDYNETTKSTDNVWSLMIISRKITNKPLFWLSIHHTIVMRTALDTCTIVIIFCSNLSQQVVNLKKYLLGSVDLFMFFFSSSFERRRRNLVQNYIDSTHTWPLHVEIHTSHRQSSFLKFTSGCYLLSLAGVEQWK